MTKSVLPVSHCDPVWRNLTSISTDQHLCSTHTCVFQYVENSVFAVSVSVDPFYGTIVELLALNHRAVGCHDAQCAGKTIIPVWVWHGHHILCSHTDPLSGLNVLDSPPDDAFVTVLDLTVKSCSASSLYCV